MKCSPKRKVHAQRKFAQGALIPPAHSAVPVKEVPPPIKEDRRSIIHSKVSVDNLLDIVAFQAIHPHSEAIVIMERLAPKTDNPAPITNGKKTPKINAIKPKRSKIKNSMKLRSRRCSQIAVAPLLRRKRISYDKEDETPLKFLKISEPTSTPTSPETNVSATRPCFKRRQSIAIESGLGGRVTRSASNQDKIRKPDKTKKKTLTDQHRTKEPPVAKTLPDSSPKAFKEPAIPARFSKSATDSPKKLVAIASTSKEPIKNVTVAASDKPTPEKSKNSTPQFYGRSGIETWLNSNKGRKDGNAESTQKAKVPVVAMEEVPQKGEEPALLRSPSPCPSESLRTVRDVFGASPNVMSKRCHKCQPCTRVKVVEQISNLMHRSRRPQSKDDVYDFDANDDTVDPLPFCFNRKRNSRAQEKDKDAATSSDDEEHHLYLDLQKDSPHIIEMTSVKIPNTNKRMMKARLIPKSEAHTTEEFSIIEHENLLDQLLQTLTINVKMNASNATQEIETDVAKEAVKPVASLESTERPERLNKRRFTSKAANEEPPKKTSKAANEEPPKKTSKAANEEPPKKTSKAANEESPKKSDKTAKLVEAPTFYPTEAEFNDPISYIEKISPIAAKYGLCKVKAPESFKPKCILNDDLKFNVTNHYVARLFSRWGPAAREISAMRAYLATQNINFNRVPLLDSLEVNLPKLYSVVQRNGGLEQVLEKKRWSRVAEEMRFSKGPNTEKTLDTYYVKYLLPYDTASNQERTSIMGAVEKCWNTKHRKLVEWASNPLHHQKKLLGESDSSDEETSDDSIAVKALHEAEDCVVAGRPMNLSGFKKVAAHAMTMYLGTADATAEEIEKEYWRLVLFGTEHVCVNAASIDTAASGYGFSRNKNHPGGKHPWNLKNLSANNNNVLRSLSAVLGVTVPTLHLGMVFSTCCWHRDPHGLPWMEYMHEGPPKIWYGIPDEQSDNFRKAVEVLCPTSCQNKYIWLSSDITMIPPNLLREHKVSLSHTVQNPGEFIIVFPKSYSCSISTGFTVSESVYFATNSWLKTVHQVFQELRSSCEPTTFSLEQLLFALARDPRSSFGVLHTVHSSLTTIVDEELRHRNTLKARGATVRVRNQAKKRNGAAWNVREQDECQICRSTLYLSKVTGVLSKRSDLCLMHAIRVLETRKYSRAEVSKMEMILFYTEHQLTEIMDLLKKRLFP